MARYRRKDAPLHYTVGLRGLSRRWFVTDLLLLAERGLIPWVFAAPGWTARRCRRSSLSTGFSEIWLAVNLLLAE